MPSTGSTGLIAQDLEELLGRLAPEVCDVMGTLHGELWRSFNPEILELCRLRIASLQGDEVEKVRSPSGTAVAPEKVAAIRNWPDSLLFSEPERACLAVTEQFVGDVSSVTQSDIDALLVYFSPGQVQAFVSALLVLDQHQRLALGLRTVLSSKEEAS
ncbi:MAG: hypothetical protein CL897_00415 [Dehalococcoidia bacterium]|nr:hypothetical protein [Dehalococcoidia bacterium]|tara:strand:- start:312 stop:785 length:474 start_codon:yes stop_codon:yes gene_type:complete